MCWQRIYLRLCAFRTIRFLWRAFGLKGFHSAKGLTDYYFKDTRARALFAGNAAHSMLPLEDIPSAALRLGFDSDGARGRLGISERRREKCLKSVSRLFPNRSAAKSKRISRSKTLTRFRNQKQFYSTSRRARSSKSPDTVCPTVIKNASKHTNTARAFSKWISLCPIRFRGKQKNVSRPQPFTSAELLKRSRFPNANTTKAECPKNLSF